MIARNHPRVRVWQWGSLLDRSRFSEISDIDIAIEGFEGDAAAWSALLVAEIGKNLEVLGRIRAFLDATESRELAASGKTAATGLMVAGILENYYTCLETLFLRVSQSFENHLEEGSWHAALLDRMTLRVPGLREPVIDEGTKRDLAELLRFRHFKRYYFEFEYDWERLDFLVGKLKAPRGGRHRALPRFPGKGAEGLIGPARAPGPGA
jgi:hypothetical protein